MADSTTCHAVRRDRFLVSPCDETSDSHGCTCEVIVDFRTQVLSISADKADNHILAQCSFADIGEATLCRSSPQTPSSQQGAVQKQVVVAQPETAYCFRVTTHSWRKILSTCSFSTAMSWIKMLQKVQASACDANRYLPCTKLRAMATEGDCGSPISTTDEMTHQFSAELSSSDESVWTDTVVATDISSGVLENVAKVSSEDRCVADLLQSSSQRQPKPKAKRKLRRIPVSRKSSESSATPQIQPIKRRTVTSKKPTDSVSSETPGSAVSSGDLVEKPKIKKSNLQSRRSLRKRRDVCDSGLLLAREAPIDCHGSPISEHSNAERIAKDCALVMMPKVNPHGACETNSIGTL